MTSGWPIYSSEPFGIKADYSWEEIGTIFRIMGDHKVSLLIETGVGQGDLAAWMIAKATFDNEFSYLGITNDPGSVDPKLQAMIISSPQVFISVGAPCSDAMITRVSKLIQNSSVAMVLCSGLAIEKEVNKYIEILRPGDIISAHRFASKYNGATIITGSRNGKMKRLLYPRMDTVIAGVLT